MTTKVKVKDANLNSTAAAQTLLGLIDDYHAFNPGGVEVFSYPTAVEFSKQVSRGRPCVYRLQPQPQPEPLSPQSETSLNHPQPQPQPQLRQQQKEEADAILSCPAFSWTKEELCEKVKEDVEVAVTPDGRADSLYPYPYTSSHRKSSDSGVAISGHVENKESRIGEGDRERDEDEDEDEEIFVQPATVSMTLSSLLEKICGSQSPSPSSLRESLGEAQALEESGRDPLSSRAPASALAPAPVYYLQSQNSNLTTTSLSTLLTDVPPEIPFATPVLGEPEAVNIWMGNASSVTSTHRDPYENLYLVLRGKKLFTLWPPCEELCLHAKKVRTAHHVYDPTSSPPSFRIVLDHPPAPTPSPSPSSPLSDSEVDTTDDGRIPWIPIDPLNLPPPHILDSRYPYYRHSHPLTITVSPGELLYLPSGWFHNVRQECGLWDNGDVAPCIAVNYWFDMDYEGEKYVTREMLGRLVEMARQDRRYQ